MKSKKYIVLAVLLAAFGIGFNPSAADSGNILTQMDLKRSNDADSVDVVLYITGNNPNAVVTRKSNNRYIVLLPNVSGSSDVAPSIGGVKDLITDVNVKHVNDGIGGYTKITFDTTKPITIKTATKKANPLTQAQKDTKTIIAKNTAVTPAAEKKSSAEKPVANTQTQKAAAPAVSKTTAKQNPQSVSVNSKANTTQPKQEIKAKPVSTPKLVPVDVSKVVSKVKPAQKVSENTPQKVVQKQETTPQTKVAENNTKPSNHDYINEAYTPKMKFDSDGKRIMDLEPRVSHKLSDDTQNVTEATTPKATVNKGNSENSTYSDIALKEENKSANLPVWLLIAGSSIIGLCFAYLIFDAISRKNQKEENRLESFFKLSEKNREKRRKREYYDIVNNKELSWQEKYKLYSEKENNAKQNSENDMQYVTDLNSLKSTIVAPNTNNQGQEKLYNFPKSQKDKAGEELKARISQLEHTIAQTPSEKSDTVTSGVVKSEDNAIIKKFSDIKLKSFTRPISLKETNRATSFGNNKINIDKLKNMYFTDNGEMKMGKGKSSYEVSSIEEYLSILDGEEQGTQSSAMATNPVKSSMMWISRPKTNDNMSISGFGNGMIVKSGYNIDSDKGFYIVDTDGVSALVGRNGEDITILKKFDRQIDQPLQVRLNNDNIYIVRVGSFKCLVDVAKDKMGTLIEI